MQEDEDAVDKRFKQAMIEGTERWISMVEDKLGGTGIRAIACPANDDMFEIDDLLAHASYRETGDEEHPMELDGFRIISMGWTNPRRPHAVLTRSWSLVSAWSRFLRRGSSGASSRKSMRCWKSICKCTRKSSRPSDVTPCCAPMSRVHVSGCVRNPTRGFAMYPKSQSSRDAHPGLAIAEGPLLLPEPACLDDRLRSIRDRREAQPPVRVDHQEFKGAIASVDPDPAT